MKALRLALYVLACSVLHVTGFLDPEITTKVPLTPDYNEKYSHVFIYVDPIVNKSQFCPEACELINYQFCNTKPYFNLAEVGTILESSEEDWEQTPSRAGKNYALQSDPGLSTCFCIRTNNKNTLFSFLDPPLEIANKLKELEDSLEEHKRIAMHNNPDPNAYFKDIMRVKSTFLTDLEEDLNDILSGIRKLRGDLKTNDYVSFSIKEAFYSIVYDNLKELYFENTIKQLDANRVSGENEIKEKKNEIKEEKKPWRCSLNRIGTLRGKKYSTEEEIKILEEKKENQMNILHILKRILQALEKVQKWLDIVPNYEAFPFMAYKCANATELPFTLQGYVPFLKQGNHKLPQNVSKVYLRFPQASNDDCKAQCTKFGLSPNPGETQTQTSTLVDNNKAYFIKTNLRGGVISISYLNKSQNSTPLPETHGCFCGNL